MNDKLVKRLWAAQFCAEETAKEYHTLGSIHAERFDTIALEIKAIRIKLQTMFRPERRPNVPPF